MATNKDNFAVKSEIILPLICQLWHILCPSFPERITLRTVPGDDSSRANMLRQKFQKANWPGYSWNFSSREQLDWEWKGSVRTNSLQSWFQVILQWC